MAVRTEGLSRVRGAKRFGFAALLVLTVSVGLLGRQAAGAATTAPVGPSSSSMAVGTESPHNSELDCRLPAAPGHDAAWSASCPSPSELR